MGESIVIVRENIAIVGETVIVGESIVNQPPQLRLKKKIRIFCFVFVFQENGKSFH